MLQMRLSLLLVVHSPYPPYRSLTPAYAQNGLGGFGLPRAPSERALPRLRPSAGLPRSQTASQAIRRLCNLAMDLHCYPSLTPALTYSLTQSKSLLPLEPTLNSHGGHGKHKHVS